MILSCFTDHFQEDLSYGIPVCYGSLEQYTMS